MFNHWHYVWSAVMFYTRLPVPGSAQHSEQILNKSRQYFPMIGLLVGSIGAGVLAAVASFLPASIAVLVSMAATVLATGAFHEDGLADCCDGFGASRDPEKILIIMKDSRVGSFALVGVLLVFGLKFSALTSITETSWVQATVALIAAHVLSRVAASTVADRLPYARLLDQATGGESKIKPIASEPLSIAERLYGTSFALAPLAAVWWAFGWVGVMASLASAVTVTGASEIYLRRRLGGYTGDCLGATQQLAEIGVYLALLATFGGG